MQSPPLTPRLNISLGNFTQTFARAEISGALSFITFCFFKNVWLLYKSWRYFGSVSEGEWNCVGGSSELSKFISAAQGKSLGG